MESLKLLNNRYQLLSVIKRGGFGTIYKGYDNVLGKDIAVKEINQDLVEDKWYIDQFQNEARHVAQMHHQNIVHIFDLVQTKEGQFYIVMEFIDGFDLIHFLKRSKLTDKAVPVHIAVHIVAEICKALDYAHNCRNTESNEPLNLVHQDISPGNIMISGTGIVKLIDFGIAGVQKEAVSDASTITLQGKVQYMSPEHVSTEHTLDKRSDIFSLGLVLYELVERKRFFQGDDTQGIVETLRDGKIKLKGFSRSPKPLQKIIKKALEKTPEKRFQNANQFYIDLVTYLVMNGAPTAIDAELVEFVQESTIAEASSQSTDTLGVTSPSPAIENNHKIDLGTEDGLKSNHLDQGAPMPNGGIVTNEPFGQALNLPPAPVGPIPEASFDDDDEIKTVIDVIRLSARGHKKLVVKSLISVAAMLFSFLLLDISMQWTDFGTGIYDFLFPPAIRIASMPAGAQVFLNNEALPGKTPLAIDKIGPGIYELKLVLKPYEFIVKSLHIPSKGQITVKGEEMRRGNKPYTFKFKTTLKIESTPENAEVFINGIKFGQNTPCSVTWEIGERCDIQLKKAGFADLIGFALDEQMIEEIEDRRLWNYDVQVEPTINHRIRGLFGKLVSINSSPPKAAIYLDNNANPIGYTSAEKGYFLTAASHSIVLKKKGYNTKKLNIKVSANTPTKIFEVLARPVKFVAYSVADKNKKELRTTLTKLTRGKKTVSSGRITPLTVNLQPQTYYATFSKPGYEDLRVKVTPSTNLVTARMQPSSGQFSVVVLDNSTRRPLSNVEVRYKAMDKRNRARESLDVTDLDGTVNGILKAGLYLFRTSKNGYAYQEQSVVIESAGMSLLEFNLAKEVNE